MWSGGIKCQLCPMTFSDQSAVSAHYDTAHVPTSSRPEHPDARHGCEVCRKKFTTKRSLRQHLYTEHGLGDIKKFTCDVCSRVFNKKCNFNAHMKKVHMAR